MGPSCVLTISLVDPERKDFVLGHIINPLLTKVVRSRWLTINLVHKFNYYMASSASGQDERILCSDWLPERARWAHLACSRFPLLIPKEKILF